MAFMPRQPRAAPGGYVYHCLNCAVARLPLFQKDGDFDAFERVLLEGRQRHPIRIQSLRFGRLAGEDGGESRAWSSRRARAADRGSSRINDPRPLSFPEEKDLNFPLPLHPFPYKGGQ